MHDDYNTGEHQTNYACDVMTGVSTQEKADPLMILHAVEMASTGFQVHIYSQDTDVLLLALCRVPLLGKVMLQPIYDKLGPERPAALINWHALTGRDMTGHIQEK